MEDISIVIFGAKLNGGDVKWFCQLSKFKKKQWIKANTYMQDDATIDEWIANPPAQKPGGCGCGCK